MGIRLVPSSSSTMEQKGMKRVEIVGQNDKRLFFVEVYREIFCLYNLSTRETVCYYPCYEFPPGWHITPNLWSMEMTMLQYIKYIVDPYIQSVQVLLYTPTTPGVIIIDNFKGQVTDKVISLLEKCHLHVYLLPANTTYVLQPMDVSVNKPAKSFLKKQFAEWYSEQLLQQIENQNAVSVSDVVLEPVDLSLARMKHISTNWLVEMWEYIVDNPQFVVNGFITSETCCALDGVISDDELDDLLG